MAVMGFVYILRPQIKVREYRRGNQKCTIQRNCQQRAHKTKTSSYLL